MANEVVVLQPGDERAQKIARAMASQTANAIIQAFSSGPLTSSEVARQMKIPITTATYHIENLLEAGLLEVVDTRWSEKGREVKVYGLTEQVLIIAPPVSDLRSVLKKYTMLFALIVLATVGLRVLLPALLPPSPDAEPLLQRAVTETGEKVSTFDVPATGAAVAPPVHDLVMGFFFGACVVLLALLVYEVFYWWRTSRRYRERLEKEQDMSDETR
jgi:DNA-binding transcriptional ArsR family regulator